MFDDETLKTWRDVEMAALMCPFLRAAVEHVKQRNCTPEQALIEVAIGLSQDRARLLGELTDISLRRLSDMFNNQPVPSDTV